MDRRKIAADRILSLSKILRADSDYFYDPSHKNRPSGGGWHQTPKGWSRKKIDENTEHTLEQKKLVQDSKSEKWHERRAVAQNPKTPIETLIDLANDESSVVYEEALKNPSIPQEILREKSRSEEFTNAISRNPRCPEDLLEDLSKSRWTRTRSGVGANPNTSEKILETLSNDEEREVREAVASNEEASSELLEKLSKDKEWPVRREVAKNKNTSVNVLDDLSRERNRYVIEEVLKNPNISSKSLEGLEDRDDETREMIANHPNTSPEMLRRFSRDSYNGVLRGNVARNPHTPQDTLESLSNDKDPYVRSGVAKNPITSVEVLKRLIEDSSQEVRSWAKKSLEKRS